MRGRIGNPKQKLRGDRKKGNYIRVDTTTNNKDYYYQQHKQLDLTTIAPKTTHWALRDLLKTIVVNYRQFEGTRIIRGNGHKKTRTNARPLAKAKQNEGRGEKRAAR